MKTVLITGASSGFGEASLKLLAKNKYKIIALARNEEKLKKLKEKYKNIHILKIDIRDKKKIKESIQKLAKEYKNIDVLINNAGLALGIEKVNEANLEDWDTMIDTNIKGLIYITKEVLNIMIKNNKGYIINLGSIAGQWPYTGGNVYGATKAFVKQFSLNLRTDIKGKNIRVTELSPGLSKTNFSLVRFKGDQNKAKAVYEGVKALKAKDIAKIIKFLIQSKEHINISSLELMPTCQSPNGLDIVAIKKGK